MLQNPCKTLGFKKNMVYKIPPGGGGKPYPASGLIDVCIPTLLYETNEVASACAPHSLINKKH